MPFGGQCGFIVTVCKTQLSTNGRAARKIRAVWVASYWVSVWIVPQPGGDHERTCQKSDNKKIWGTLPLDG